MQQEWSLNQRKHSDWFNEKDDKIGQLLDTKYSLYKSLSDQNKNRLPLEKSLREHKATLQCELREIKTKL